MNKRLICFLLTLVMVLSLVPAAALTASAASLSVSASAISVLKKQIPFRDKHYLAQGTDDVRIGYGTACEEGDHKVELVNGVPQLKYDADHEMHTITEKRADTLLRSALASYDTAVAGFATANKLSLNQYQHDALVLFSYQYGTAWMSGSSSVQRAIVSGADTNELLNAMRSWVKRDDSWIITCVQMYKEGKYSNVVTNDLYGEVTYYANGGFMAQGDSYTMLFDRSKNAAHIPAPTRVGYTFLGWYLRQNDTAPWQYVPQLTQLCHGHTLWALWQDNNQTKNPTNSVGVPVKYTLKRSDLASTIQYKLPYPDVNAKGVETNGRVETDTVTVTADYIGADGTRWAKLASKKWVIVKAGANGVGNGSNGVEIDVTVTVTNATLNSRVNATIFSAKNGTYSQGNKLRIINTAQADGFLWGQVAKSATDNTPIGWVALMYTNWNSVKDSAAATGSANNGNVIARATVTYNGYVNVRNEPGTDNRIVGTVSKNETLDLYEIRTVNGHRWGRCSAGWFCLTYATVTMLTDKPVQDTGAAAYIFTGKAQGEVTARESATSNSNEVAKIPDGKAVNIGSLMNIGDGTWAKVTWTVTEKDKDGKDKTVVKSGWAPLQEGGRNGLTTTYANANPCIVIDPVDYTVIADHVIVRTAASNSADRVVELNKGVSVRVTTLTLVGEDLWGFTNDEGNNTNQHASTPAVQYMGYINLSSVNVSRDKLAPEMNNSSSHETGKIATVINTDSVRVRSYGATYGNVTGSLPGGATVRVWSEENENGWYKVDSNQNGIYEYELDGWVFGNYLDVRVGTIGSAESNVTNPETGLSGVTGVGIVANTYSGVNIRSGAGTGYALVGKALPGTQLNILETKTVGATQWGRIDKGWVCMDYVTMVTSTPNAPATGTGGNGTGVGDLSKVETSSTTAVYTGKTTQEVNIRKEPVLDNTTDAGTVVRVVPANSNITIYELVAVKDYVVETVEDGNNGATTTTTERVSYWARVNDGYLYNPEAHITLDGLNEKVHTLTGSDTLNVREQPETGNVIDELEKGDQVTVSALEIRKDKVWGRIDTEKGTGWIRMDYMAEGAYYEEKVPETTTPPSQPVLGSTGNTTTGGIVNNASGYKYTGKVINTNKVNVRATASISSDVTTQLSSGASLVIYETTIAENMAWGRCDAGWVYLYYVDLVPCVAGAVDARVVYNDNTIVYTDVNKSSVAGTYARMSVVDIYEIVDKMARTDLGWVSTTDLLS